MTMYNCLNCNMSIQIVQLNVLKISSFLNQFDITIRSKIAALNEKLNKLERTVEYCEAATKSALDKQTKH